MICQIKKTDRYLQALKSQGLAVEPSRNQRATLCFHNFGMILTYAHSRSTSQHQATKDDPAKSVLEGQQNTLRADSAASHLRLIDIHVSSIFSFSFNLGACRFARDCEHKRQMYIFINIVVVCENIGWF